MTTDAEPTTVALTVSPTLLVVIAVPAASVMGLLIIIIAFTLGVLVTMYRTKTKEDSAMVPMAQGVAATPAVETATGVELESAHDYEEIVLADRDINMYTSNVAYGSHPQYSYCS